MINPRKDIPGAVPAYSSVLVIIGSPTTANPTGAAPVQVELRVQINIMTIFGPFLAAIKYIYVGYGMQSARSYQLYLKEPITVLMMTKRTYLSSDL